MTNLYNLQVNDPVVVSPGMSRQGAFLGTVIKKGRKLITVQPEGTKAEHQQLVFRLENGDYNDRDYPHRYSVYTPSEWGELKRRSKLREIISRKGVRLETKFSTKVLEGLVAVLKEAESDNGSLD